MPARSTIGLLLIVFFQSSSLRAEYVIPDEVPLTALVHDQRNVTLYTSASNPSRDPKQWRFWYDPWITYDASKPLHQFNEQVRAQFSFASSVLDHLARTAIVSRMHPDVEKFSMFWTIEPLPMDTLTIYVTDQLSLPVPALYPCTKFNLSSVFTFECQFHCTSMAIAHHITQVLLCGKLTFHLEYYIQSTTKPIVVPPRLATVFNLQNLRSMLSTDKYIHPRQEKKFVEKYFVQIQSIDDTIKEADLQDLFRLGVNSTTRSQLNQSRGLWSGEDVESIINQDLFYLRFRSKHQVTFSLKAADSPWALVSDKKQTVNITEMQALLADQLNIDADWSSQETKWKIRSITVRFVTNILDYLQLILINRQYATDQLNATIHQAIDCRDWSGRCVCLSTSPSVVLLNSAQFVRIPDINMDFSTTGLTFELWLRPDALPKSASALRLLDFRGEYLLAYQPKGEILFSITDQTQSHLYTTSLQSIPLDQWTHISCVHSIVDNQLQLYLNGEYVSSIVTRVKTNQIANDIVLGQQFIGAVRDLRLWGCVKNADEIRYSKETKALLGNETCLIGVWPMGDGTGQMIVDAGLNGPPHPGTLGFDDNPNLFSDPIWTHVLPTPPTPPEPPVLTYRIFRENLTSPFMAKWGSIYDLPTPNDYDGDGLADFAIYRPSTLTWMVSQSNNPSIMIMKLWGLPGDIPVQVNFDGDRFADFAVYRPSTSEWIAHLSSNPNFRYIQKWGQPDDRPAPGDFDGDGKTDFVVYRKGSYYINPSSDPSIQWTKQWGQPGDVPVPNCDFDADGRTDFTVWTPKTGIWSWIPSASPWLIYQKQWGARHDKALCGDFDGDKRRDFIAYRNWTGEWFVLPYSVSSFVITFRWGYSTDLPVAGDYDGDGRADFGLWRPRKNRTYVWEIIPSIMPVTMLRKAWGIANDIPVVGDFDLDKRSDFTVWRPTNGFWYILLIGRPGIQQIKHWGFTSNDTAVAGDWDGDLITDYTIYRPTTGYWYIMLSRNPILQIFMQFGSPQFKDVAVPGDFDGDGKSDFAVWRPSTGVWFILPSSNPAHIVMSQWGLPEDIPVTGADFDGDGKTDVAVWRPSTGSWYILPSSNPIYPFFGPSIIRQPVLTLPPGPPGPPPSVAAAAGPPPSGPVAAGPSPMAPVAAGPPSGFPQG